MGGTCGMHWRGVDRRMVSEGDWLGECRLDPVGSG
jgi:hypothetical protein